MASEAQGGDEPTHPQELGDGWEYDDGPTIPTDMPVVAEFSDGTTIEGKLQAIWTHEGEPAMIEIVERDDDTEFDDVPLVVPEDRVKVGGA